MSEKPFTVYPGQFFCHKCKETASTARLWKDTLDLTWQCPNKHISKVNFTTKKTKKDYERKNRE